MTIEQIEALLARVESDFLLSKTEQLRVLMHLEQALALPLEETLYANDNDFCVRVHH